MQPVRGSLAGPEAGHPPGSWRREAAPGFTAGVPSKPVFWLAGVDSRGWRAASALHPRNRLSYFISISKICPSAPPAFESVCGTVVSTHR
jgi:hypothetical protein